MKWGSALAVASAILCTLSRSQRICEKNSTRKKTDIEDTTLTDEEAVVLDLDPLVEDETETVVAAVAEDDVTSLTWTGRSTTRCFSVIILDENTRLLQTRHTIFANNLKCSALSSTLYRFSLCLIDRLCISFVGRN